MRKFNKILMIFAVVSLSLAPFGGLLTTWDVIEAETGGDIVVSSLMFALLIACIKIVHLIWSEKI